MSKNSTDHINESLQEISPVPEKNATPTETAQKLGLDNSMAYIEADSFIGNPYSILGNVIEVRKQNGVCPGKLNDEGVVIEFSPTKIVGAVIDESSKIKEPIKRDSIIVDKKLSAGIGFLNYLNAHFEGESSFSIMVFDQNGGTLNRDGDAWDEALEKWKEKNKRLFEDPEICYLYVVIGFIQKYIIRRKYKKFTAGAKGGAYGLNLNGELYTSDEDYSLDILFGLHPAILKRPESVTKSVDLAEANKIELTKEDMSVFKSLSSQRIGIRKE